MPLVSVIIPALNEADNILAAIAAARRAYSPEEVEILVVDGGSSDGTPDLVPDDALLLHAARGRAVQMNRGASEARGDVLLFCHADSRLPAGWHDAIVTALARPGVSGGAFQTEIVPARGILHLINRLHLPADWRILFGDTGQFMTRATFEQIGGYPEIPLMEDVEMARALHRVGRLVRVPLRLQTSSRRFLEQGPWRQWLLSFLLMIRYLYLGATPDQIVRRYRSSREEAL